MGESVRVSVVIPVYNGADTVGRTIQSVLAQDYASYELIVVDDGSTDSTADVIRSFGARIRYVRQDNRGPAAARNAGAKLAHGKYLAFLDSDDVWRPQFLARSVAALDRRPDAVLAYASFITDKPGEEPGIVDTGLSDPTDPVAFDIVKMMTSAVLIRRDIYEHLGGMREEFRAPGFEDTYFWYRARELGEFAHVSEPLMIYRLREFPERAYKYESGRRLFERLMIERYGRKARRVIMGARVNFASGAVQQALRRIDSGDFRSGAIALKDAIKTCPTLLLNPNMLRRILRGRNFARLLRVVFRSASGPTAVAR